MSLLRMLSIAVASLASSIIALPSPLCAAGAGDRDVAAAVGACCFIDESCQLLDAATCAAQAGLYQGDGTACDAGLCDDQGPFGACCLWSNYTCSIRTPDDCAAIGGAYFGDGSDCQPCWRPDGACCLPDSSCASPMYLEDCEAAGGVFQGWGSFCEGPCWASDGACCFDGSCFDMSEILCAINGGVWYSGQSCAETACSPFTGVGEPEGQPFSLLVTPNPSRGMTSFALQAPREDEISLSIYDSSGRLLRTLARAQLADGALSVTWDQRDVSGRTVPAGAYFARLTSRAGHDVTERVTVVR